MEAMRMQYFQTQQNYMLKKKAAQPMRMQDFQTQQKPHVTEAWHNADEALLVDFKYDGYFTVYLDLEKSWITSGSQWVKGESKNY